MSAARLSARQFLLGLDTIPGPGRYGDCVAKRLKARDLARRGLLNQLRQALLLTTALMIGPKDSSPSTDALAT